MIAPLDPKEWKRRPQTPAPTPPPRPSLRPVRYGMRLLARGFEALSVALRAADESIEELGREFDRARTAERAAARLTWSREAGLRPRPIIVDTRTRIRRQPGRRVPRGE